MSTSTDDRAHGRASGFIPISIDRRPYKAPEEQMTGQDIRDLADPQIGPDRDLYLDTSGGGSTLIGDEDLIDLKPGMHFFSVPKSINEG